jgi:hypothetical protein
MSTGATALPPPVAAGLMVINETTCQSERWMLATIVPIS